MSKRRPSRDCPQCQRRTEHMMQHDSFFCPHCDIWTEKPCSCDPSECEFTGRPERPSQVQT
jgi:hypothetical protein